MVTLSEGVQTAPSTGQGVLTNSRDVGIHLAEHPSNPRPLIEPNHMYIRIAQPGRRCPGPDGHPDANPFITQEAIYALHP